MVPLGVQWSHWGYSGPTMGTVVPYSCPTRGTVVTALGPTGGTEVLLEGGGPTTRKSVGVLTVKSAGEGEGGESSSVGERYGGDRLHSADSGGDRTILM